jgi:hypothetical protein
LHLENILTNWVNLADDNRKTGREPTVDISKLMGRRAEVVAEATESLEHLESVIEQGLAHFHAVGRALKVIKEKKLYSPKYPTYPDYCSARWGFSMTHASRLVEAADVVDGLIASGVIKLPSVESHARVLAKIAPESRAEAWKAATAQLDDDGLTAETLEAVVAKIAPGSSNKKPRARKVPKKIALKGRIGKVAWSVTVERKGHIDPTEVLRDALAQLEAKSSTKAA